MEDEKEKMIREPAVEQKKKKVSRTKISPKGEKGTHRRAYRKFFWTVC